MSLDPPAPTAVLLSPPGLGHIDATHADQSAPDHTLLAPDALSPRARKPANLLGLGMPDILASPSPRITTSALVEYPHLGHYLFLLLSTSQGSPPRGQHPLSVSSSGESDGSDNEDATGTTDAGAEQKTPRRVPMLRTVSSTIRIRAIDKDAFVRKVVEMLDNAEEEEVKEMLKPHMGTHALDELLMDEICLDCMHRRRDDVENVPYAPHLTPTRIRGSPSVNSVVVRPYTPIRLPSFRGRTPLGRPSSPNPGLSSGAQTPTLPHGPSTLARSEMASGIARLESTSPSPPKMLSATAATFSPSPRVVSAPLTSTIGFSPSDPWKDAPVEPVRTASPFGVIGRPTPLSSTNSGLATATPLFSGQLSPFHTPAGTPHRSTIKIPDVFFSPAITQSRTTTRELIPDDDDDDEFSPFGRSLPKLHHHEQTLTLLNSAAKPFQPFNGADVLFGSSSTLSSSIPQSDSSFSYDSNGSGDSDSHDQDEAAAGMTPLDVLAQVFASVSRSELEEALHRSGYDFEGAMALLVSQYTLPRSGASTPQRVSSPRPMVIVGTRGGIASNHHAPLTGHFVQGGRSIGNMSPGLGGARSPGGQAIRMCRYFLAGECRRSDCRFSHDLDRAMCRFWLRGYCSKGKSCEFLHQLPSKLDASALSTAMSEVELSSDGSAQPTPIGAQQNEEFPDLLTARLGRQSRFDPSRNRFANAVKRATPAPVNSLSVQIGGARLTPAVHSTNHSVTAAESQVQAPVPRASQRLKLRVAMLLPTLLTGAVVNELYMKNRAGAISLGNARNACLARAADAFRRGDGAAAKRFSREGKSLNERLLNEAADVAQLLVRDRREAAQQAVRERDPAWTDDPSDRSARGKECAGGLGVIMGVASAKHVPNGDRLSTDERTECLLDLHTLHGQEGSDILLQFLAELERENFRGLAYVVVGEGKHVGTQDSLRGASKVRLGTSVKQSLADWGYAWNESGGVLCVDACRV